MIVASFLTEPLEVGGLVLTAAGFGVGFASLWALLGGSNGSEIADAAAKGGAIGFLIGIYLGAAAAVYLLTGP